MEKEIIHGNITNLKKSVIAELLQLYDWQADIEDSDSIVPTGLATKLLKISEQIGREVSLYIDRKNCVSAVAVGDWRSVSLPSNKMRRNTHGLNSLRCLHTHLQGSADISDVDINALLEFNFDLIAAIAYVDADIHCGFAYIVGWQENKPHCDYIEGVALSDMQSLSFKRLLSNIEAAYTRSKSFKTVENEREVAILVGCSSDDGWQKEQSIAELTELAKTAGAEVAASLTQQREIPDNRYFIGQGKLEELHLLAQANRAKIIIFDDELSPTQQRNLENFTGLKIIDRTALILDIFAARAASHEGKLQVSLAQLKYRLPRLGGQGLILSRLGGGIGTRGPGETKLEVDRRRIRKKIHEIEQELKRIIAHRQRHRQERKKNMLPVISIVGYTNAGKSTLLNVLTKAEVVAENKLFSTLDTTTRQLEVENCGKILLTDTVGFIHKLPHNLIKAFRATLEETVHSDLLVHVIDLSSTDFPLHINTVNEVLTEIGAGDKPRILVFNKIDAVDSEFNIEKLQKYNDYCIVSALKKTGLDDLLEMIANFVRQLHKVINILVPYEQFSIITDLHDAAAVIEMEYCPEGIRALINVNERHYGKIKKFIIDENN